MTDSFKAFLQWAGDKGYDTAHIYDIDYSKWLALNPMTADLWGAWQAAANTTAAVKDSLTVDQAGDAVDAQFAIDKLALMFDAWENGCPCYEDPESCGNYIGIAFRLADEDFHAIANFLNRVRPVAAIKQGGGV